MDERIATCALDHYDKVLPANKGKPKDTEWTVYAAIVAAEQAGDDNTEKLWVVSCATGTKCSSFNPPKDASSEDKEVETNVLRDCHAEALARRGLVKVLWKEICAYQKDTAVFLDSKNRLLDPLDASSVENPSFCLKANVTLHLYVSDPPCGDASIYPLLGGGDKEDDSSNGNANKNESEEQPSKKAKTTNHGINFTGAKVIVNSLNGVQAKDCTELLPGSSSASQQTLTNPQNKPQAPEASNIVVAREGVQLLGKLRTKSGRSNLPAHMRSSCMSCSDKLVRWCVLGLQGALLTKYISKPLRLESIVVSQDQRALSRSAQEEALCRATQRRVASTLEYLDKQSGSEASKSGNNIYCTTIWKGPSLHIVTPTFARGKSTMEYERRLPTITNNTAPNKKRPRGGSNSSNTVSPCGVCLNWDQSTPSSIEQIVGARGLCQGKKPKAARDYKHMTSRLSRTTFGEHAKLVWKKSGAPEKVMAYKEWKQAHAEDSYQKARLRIFEGGPLAGWLQS